MQSLLPEHKLPHVCTHCQVVPPTHTPNKHSHSPVEQLAVEAPHVEAVLHLVQARHRGGNVAACGQDRTGQRMCI